VRECRAQNLAKTAQVPILLSKVPPRKTRGPGSRSVTRRSGWPRAAAPALPPPRADALRVPTAARTAIASSVNLQPNALPASGPSRYDTKQLQSRSKMRQDSKCIYWQLEGGSCMTRRGGHRPPRVQAARVLTARCATQHRQRQHLDAPGSLRRCGRSSEAASSGVPRSPQQIAARRAAVLR
jgi:hypothetical protein